MARRQDMRHHNPRAGGRGGLPFRQQAAIAAALFATSILAWSGSAETAFFLVLLGVLSVPLLSGAEARSAMAAPPGTAPAPGPLRLAVESQTSAYSRDGDVPERGDRPTPPPRDWLEPEHLAENWLLGTRALRQTGMENALHRGLDIVASLSLLLLTLPLLLLVAALIKLDSRGPVFYRQERVGRDHRTFSILKFRSMTTDAEKAGPAMWASVGDSRVTRIGRYLRAYRIDEIPQAINILRGEMSFVGPRPERPEFVTKLTAAIPHYADRAVVRPGLTGWAQVRYPYGASVEDARNKLSFDLWYIQERSIGLDLRIVLATVRVVLGQVGSR